MYEVTVKKSGPRRVLGLTHIGAYPLIGEAFGRLGPVALTAGLKGKLVGIYLDDPMAVPEHALRSVAGVAAGWKTPIPAGLEEHRLPGGQMAVLRLVGPYGGLAGAWQYLYSQWLPQHGKTAAGIPFEVYHNTPEDTAPEDLVTEICVPL